MPIIKIVPMPGPPGTGNGISSVEPLNLNDQNGDLLLSITKSGTGTTRITAPQDDLALRSARDIILYPGDDGPGKVYINWGDANYTPNASNEVATLADIDEAIASANLGDIKTRIWGYPSDNAVAVMPAIDNESIALKSSDAAAIRWHIRNNTGLYVNPVSATVTPGDGNYQVVFTIPEQDSVPPTGEYYYHIYCPENSAFDAALFAAAATTTTITFYYEGDPGAFDPTDAQITFPSVYSQFEVDSNGAHVKVADWSSGPAGYSYTWDFTKEGGIHFPYQSSNARTGYGDVLKFATSFDQAIITGPTPTYQNPTANRLVVAGQDGVSGDGYDGEGGDIYLWAGIGGGSNGDGGDIKIDGGNGASSGTGGYVKVRGGDGDNGNGGFIELSAGDSYNSSGGNVDISAGNNFAATSSPGGNVSIYGGGSGDSSLGGNILLETFQNGKITLNGTGGEFLNDSSNASNQIATLGNLGVYPRVIASDGSPLTGSLIHVGKMLYANLAATQAEFTIPTNANVAFPIGSEIKFVTSDESPWHIAAADYGTTTVWGEAPSYTWSNQAPFIVPTNSSATLLKVDTDLWILSGLRLTD